MHHTGNRRGGWDVSPKSLTDLVLAQACSRVTMSLPSAKEFIITKRKKHSLLLQMAKHSSANEKQRILIKPLFALALLDVVHGEAA